MARGSASCLETRHEQHKFPDMFVGYLVERHSRTQADLVDQLFNSSEKRLARTLLVLSRVGTHDVVAAFQTNPRSSRSSSRD